MKRVDHLQPQSDQQTAVLTVIAPRNIGSIYNSTARRRKVFNRQCTCDQENLAIHYMHRVRVRPLGLLGYKMIREKKIIKLLNRCHQYRWLEVMVGLWRWLKYAFMPGPAQQCASLCFMYGYVNNPDID